MPLYQTKTIANILEPVAQQVSTIYQNQERKYKQSIPLGQQIDHPSRGGRGWQLHAQLGGPRGGCE